jgi:hypothetical protein
MTKEQILAMEPAELNIAVAEEIFNAKVISKEGDPEAKLLIGWYGKDAWKPMRHSWRTAVWHRSEESAWLDCPKFGEDISAAWEVVEKVQGFSNIDIELFQDARIDGRIRIECDENKEEILLPFGKAQNAGFPKIVTEAICKAALLALGEVKEREGTV